MAIVPFKLTKEQKEGLIKLEADIKSVEFEIARAKRAGLDVTELEAKFQKAKKLREGIMKEYG